MMGVIAGIMVVCAVLAIWNAVAEVRMIRRERERCRLWKEELDRRLAAIDRDAEARWRETGAAIGVDLGRYPGAGMSIYREPGRELTAEERAEISRPRFLLASGCACVGAVCFCNYWRWIQSRMRATPVEELLRFHGNERMRNGNR